MDTKKVKITLNVLDGPNRDRLFDACKYAFDSSGAKVPSGFKIDKTYLEKTRYAIKNIVDVRLLSVGHECGSGHQFNLGGNCTVIFADGHKESCNFEAYYDSQLRKGKFSIVADEIPEAKRTIPIPADATVYRKVHFR